MYKFQQLALSMSQVHSLFPETPMQKFTPVRSKALPSHDPFMEEESVMIYGTNIKVRQVMALIEKFLLEFEENRKEGDEIISEHTYRIKLNDLSSQQSSTLFEIQGTHIKEFNQQLYCQLLYYPAEMISCFDLVIKDLFQKYFIEQETEATQRLSKINHKEKIMMCLKGLHINDKMCVKQLGPNLIDRLVLIEAIVIRVSQVFPEMKRALFQCQNCKQEIGVNLSNAKVQQPQTCRVCNQKGTLELIHNLCYFTDKQYIKFQELPEKVSEGDTPCSMTAIVYDINVDGFRPGDRLELIGIYRAQPVKLDRYKGSLRTVFNTYIDVVSFNLLEESKFRVDQSYTTFSDWERKEFESFANDPECINNLVKSFSPSIYGQQIVKKGVLAQLFGGTRKQISDRGRFRADINICLVGDPSTAKSQMLQQVFKIAPRSIYTSGRGSSAIGLTANVRKDPETHEFVLESGALVLADKGICCIDEFDKMEDNSKTILLEAMEQQTISIAKAGIVCQLNSRTAILAAANPIGSKYDPKKSVVQNINLSPMLLSRFDLIYIMLDIANQMSDERLATHILDFYTSRVKPKVNNAPLDSRKLARYISYARQTVHPVISKEAGEKIVRQYISMRAIGISKKTITATPRILQSIIRISESFAKMKLSTVVTEDDVMEAVNLIEKATLATATDPQTGMINMDIITTGRSSAQRKRVMEISESMKKFIFSNESKYMKITKIDRFMPDFEAMHPLVDAGREEVLEALKVLESFDILVLFKDNKHFKLQMSNESG